jgi:hypothetical protein
MKISQLGAAVLIPATVAGVALTAMPFAQAATVAPAHHAAHHAVHRAAPARTVTKVKAAAAAKAHATSHPAAQPAATQHAASTGQAAQTPAPAQTQPQTQPQAPAATSNQPLTAGMSSFEACVAWHESGDNPTASSAGLFGILPATWAQLGYSGTAGQASVALQKVAFQRLYAQYGTSPWAPYDGC